jgi:hypothetical protein
VHSANGYLSCLWIKWVPHTLVHLHFIRWFNSSWQVTLLKISLSLSLVNFLFFFKKNIDWFSMFLYVIVNSILVPIRVWKSSKIYPIHCLLYYSNHSKDHSKVHHTSAIWTWIWQLCYNFDKILGLTLILFQKELRDNFGWLHKKIYNFWVGSKTYI